MKQQMFPPNNLENSFEWFRHQHQLKDQPFINYDNNQNQNEMSRYYGNVIQPYPQNTTQSVIQPQPVQTAQQPIVQMMEISPYGSQPSLATNFGEHFNTNGGVGEGTMFSNPSNPFEFNSSQSQPFNYQNHQTGQYPNYAYPHQTEGMQAIGHNTLSQNHYPYPQMHMGNFGNQTNFQQQPIFPVQQYQQQQLIQTGSGPFSAPAMFAPSTPYPTQPKQINQQSSNSQSSFQISSILNQFKNSSGSYDVPKMMSTAGQMMNTMNQVGGIFKQIGFFFK